MSVHVPSFVRNNPVLSYYLLTFVLSWSAILAAVGPAGFPGSPAHIQKMLPVMIVAMLLGPGAASLLFTGLVDGKAGYRELRSRLFRWRVGIGWTAVALLTAPLVWMGLNLVLSLRFHGFIPKLFTECQKGPLLAMGISAGLAAGMFEELGWTGFAIPRLRLRFGDFTTAVVVGFFWGLWHLPVNVVASGTPEGTLSVPTLIGSLIFSIGILSAYRVLMVWVWDHTGSLLIAMLMHASLTSMSIILGPSATPEMMAIAWNLVMAATLWIVVGATSMLRRRGLKKAVTRPVPS
jgi:membrane protease YdiL (CAAX protease family)